MINEIKPLLAAGVAFGIGLGLGWPLIGLLQRLKFGQSIRKEGPASHLAKAGTPTMGGLLIIAAALVGWLVSGEISALVLGVVGLIIIYGLIGLADDALIIMAQRSLGLKARQKLLAQIVGAGIIGYYFWQQQLGIAQLIPFINAVWIFPDTIWGEVLFIGYTILVVVGAANAVNLSDGLDGLAAGTTAIATLVVGLLAWWQAQPELAVLALALSGACAAFLWFNGPPARVFMGDTGSLALGAALGGLTLAGQTSLFLPIIGGIFVAEALSVMMQVVYFKRTGKRIWRMTPIHHHFELGGMSEPQVVLRFCLVGLGLGMIGLAAYLIR